VGDLGFDYWGGDYISAYIWALGTTHAAITVYDEGMYKGVVIRAIVFE
jgi:hypothetical protein